MEFAKLSAPSLKDLFVQQLQGMILSDELPMGTQLPPERELAQQMQVSRAVVNGGLAELAQQGFLEVRPRQGTFVADYRRKGNLSTLIAIMEDVYKRQTYRCPVWNLHTACSRYIRRGCKAQETRGSF